MPQHKSAEKRVRTNERDRKRNVALRSRLRKAVATQRERTDPEAAKKSLPETVAEIDRAERKGVIPGRRADRLKSRLARQINRTATR